MNLEMKNIAKAFGDNVVFKDFSHLFQEGKTTAIMGQSGCGKSTLLNMLMGLIKPDSGEILPNGYYKKSAVFQENRLCENLTAAANIRLAAGKKLPQRDIETALPAVLLDGTEKKPVKELSGGMKRRVALLRALLCDYQVLFLDEPFKGLDSDTKGTVMEYTKKMTAGRTVILVTHDKDECDFLADEIIRL